MYQTQPSPEPDALTLPSNHHHLTFKEESLIPGGAECPPLDPGVQPLLLVREEGDPHIGVTQACQVPGSQVFTLH